MNGISKEIVKLVRNWEIDTGKKVKAEDIKDGLKELGFNLIPVKKRENLLPCVCGSKRREHWYGPNFISLVCPRCRLEARGTNETELRKNWNEMIRGMK